MPRESAASVGVVGLGNIGLPAAVNLVNGGFDVVGFSRRPSARLAAAGGTVAADVTELASMDLLVMCLPSVSALEETVDALLPLAHPGQVVIELSSYPLAAKVEQADRLRSRGAEMLDCEVSGLPIQVERREALVLVSGDSATVEGVADVLDVIAGRHAYVGPFGTATKMKLIANTMVCVHNLMAAEALNLGAQLGLDPARIVDVLGHSAAGSVTFSNKAPLMVRRDFGAGHGPFRHMFGHLARATSMAGEVEATTPLLDAARSIYALAEAQGRHDEDIAAVIEVLEGVTEKKG